MADHVTGLFPYGGRGGWHAARLCCRMVIYCEGGNAAMSLSRSLSRVDFELGCVFTVFTVT